MFNNTIPTRNVKNIICYFSNGGMCSAQVIRHTINGCVLLFKYVYWGEVLLSLSMQPIVSFIYIPQRFDWHVAWHSYNTTFHSLWACWQYFRLAYNNATIRFVIKIFYIEKERKKQLLLLVSYWFCTYHSFRNVPEKSIWIISKLLFNSQNTR